MKKVQKAGCILMNVEEKSIAIVYRKKYNDYSFPKGHLEENESLKECALRETAEETKRDAVILIDEPIFIDYYTTPNRENVELFYYLAKDNGPSDNDSEDTHDTYFIPFDEVKDKLSNDSLRNVWNKVKGIVNKYLNN